MAERLGLKVVATSLLLAGVAFLGMGCQGVDISLPHSPIVEFARPTDSPFSVTQNQQPSPTPTIDQETELFNHLRDSYLSATTTDPEDTASNLILYGVMGNREVLGHAGLIKDPQGNEYLVTVDHVVIGLLGYNTKLVVPGPSEENTSTLGNRPSVPIDMSRFVVDASSESAPDPYYPDKSFGESYAVYPIKTDMNVYRFIGNLETKKIVKPLSVDENLPSTGDVVQSVGSISEDFPSHNDINTFTVSMKSNSSAVLLDSADDGSYVCNGNSGGVIKHSTGPEKKTKALGVFAKIYPTNTPVKQLPGFLMNMSLFTRSICSRVSSYVPINNILNFISNRGLNRSFK